jgi:hypothetical protein
MRLANALRVHKGRSSNASSNSLTRLWRCGSFGASNRDFWGVSSTSWLRYSISNFRDLDRLSKEDSPVAWLIVWIMWGFWCQPQLKGRTWFVNIGGGIKSSSFFHPLLGLNLNCRIFSTTKVSKAQKIKI